jgi:hypothetical protein
MDELRAAPEFASFFFSVSCAGFGGSGSCCFFLNDYDDYYDDCILAFYLISSTDFVNSSWLDCYMDCF